MTDPYETCWECGVRRQEIQRKNPISNTFEWLCKPCYDYLEKRYDDQSR